jgi:hypothetical protein
MDKKIADLRGQGSPGSAPDPPIRRHRGALPDGSGDVEASGAGVARRFETSTRPMPIRSGGHRGWSGTSTGAETPLMSSISSSSR